MSWSLKCHGPVGVLTLSNPPENLLGFTLLAELDLLLAELSTRLDISVIVLTGGVTNYFVGHADLSDVRALAAGEPTSGVPDRWALALERMSTIDQPVIAAINGQAWGGGLELTLAAQIRVASRAAHFRFLEVENGAIPGAGGTQRLPRLIGPSKAALLVLSGQQVSAPEAQKIGLVDAVLDSEDFLASVLEWVTPIAQQPRHALVAAKRALIDGSRLALSDGLAHEQRIFRSIVQSPETRALHG